MDALNRVPPFRAVMYQKWRDLLFLHWPVDAEALRDRLPAGLQLDRFDGRAYIGLIPFLVKGVRPPGVPPIPMLSRFGEVNVRTYVTADDGTRGVWFFSLDAGSAAAVAAAKALYGLPYVYARARLRRDGDRCSFRSERPAGGGACEVSWRPAGTRFVRTQPGSLDHFLVERYVLFALKRGRLHRARVDHAPYPIQPVELLQLSETLTAAAGVRVAGAPLTHASNGVDVRISWPERVGEDALV